MRKKNTSLVKIIFKFFLFKYREFKYVCLSVCLSSWLSFLVECKKMSFIIWVFHLVQKQVRHLQKSCCQKLEEKEGNM